MTRVYLDHNATTPLRSEAREAMVAAMDVVGNPSSVHGEGRAAKAIVERAREQVAVAIGAVDADVIFVASATEAAALAMRGRDLLVSGIEHDAVGAWGVAALGADGDGQVAVVDPARSCVQVANGETGVVQALPNGLALSDATQAVGKIAFDFNASGVEMVILSAHKFGGPKGVGALVVKRGTDVAAQIIGGGQESGRRAGTENVIGIAGFGAAAVSAVHDVDCGMWARVEKLRDLLEDRLAVSVKETIFVGKGARRLPNTVSMITAGWKGETQVMQMDLAGIAVSAGSACSSGKVRPSSVLRAMGYDDVQAASAIRVSMGLSTTEEDVMRFADAWLAQYEKYSAIPRVGAA
ncbi:MAG: cysteine desulfurase family protein [Rhodobacterales bacterium]|nr:cysteine desulfurase family protein [Rhodobacterales bacterium]